jgi:hypothetical protein
MEDMGIQYVKDTTTGSERGIYVSVEFFFRGGEGVATNVTGSVGCTLAKDLFTSQ